MFVNVLFLNLEVLIFYVLCEIEDVFLKVRQKRFYTSLISVIFQMLLSGIRV